MDTKQDDGSLSFLKIEPDKNSRHFNCPETTQQKLINKLSKNSKYEIKFRR
jgi:hypothetical protein